MDEVSLEPGRDDILLKPGDAITIQISTGRFLRIRAVPAKDEQPPAPSPSPEPRPDPLRPVFDPGEPPDRVSVFLPTLPNKASGFWEMADPAALEEVIGCSLSDVWADGHVTHFINARDFE